MDDGAFDFHLPHRQGLSFLLGQICGSGSLAGSMPSCGSAVACCGVRSGSAGDYLLGLGDLDLLDFTLCFGTSPNPRD